MAKPKTAVVKATTSKSKTRSKAPSAPKRAVKTAKTRPPAPGAEDRLGRLCQAIQEVREGRRSSPRTARLLASGVPKMAQKVVEEAAEAAIEAVQGRRDLLINESVDLLYNLAALWNAADVPLDALLAEMDRREAAFGMSEKLPKTDEV